MSSHTHIMDCVSIAPGDFVLVGAVHCGKTALMRALLDMDDDVLKTQAAIFHDNNVIDTPGEFIEMRNYYGALLSTVAAVSTIVYLQPANSAVFFMPRGLLQVYPEKNVVGVISKADLPDADIKAASQVLKANGIAEPYFVTSTVTGLGVPALRRHLLNLSHNPTQATERMRPSAKRRNAA